MNNLKTKPTYLDLTKLMFTNGNPKLDKNLKDEDLKKYWIKRLNLAPSTISGFNTCGSASEGCIDACLHEAGNPVFMPQKTLGRVNRTQLYFKDRAKFLSMITREIRNHEILCKKYDLKPVIRLNTTSDIMWENHKIFEHHYKWVNRPYNQHHFKRRRRYTLKSNPERSFQPLEKNNKLIEFYPILNKIGLCKESIINKMFKTKNGKNAINTYPFHLENKMAKLLYKEINIKSSKRITGNMLSNKHPQKI